MKSAIEKIYLGKTNCEHIPLPDNYNEYQKTINSIFNNFYESLNDKQKKQYTEMVELELAQQSEVLLGHYKEGFKFGLMLAAESALK